MSEKIYLKIDQQRYVKKPKVDLGDVMTVYCSKKDMIEKIGHITLVELTCLVVRCENCGRLHVYKRERKDGEGCLCCGGGPMRMLGNAIVHENKTSDVKVRISVEREELDKLIKDMDRVNWLANETYEKIRKMSIIKFEC